MDAAVNSKSYQVKVSSWILTSRRQLHRVTSSGLTTHSSFRPVLFKTSHSKKERKKEEEKNEAKKKKEKKEEGQSQKAGPHSFMDTAQSTAQR